MHELEDEEDFHVFAELTELGLGATRAAKTWSQLMSVDLSFYRSRTSQRLRAEGHTQGLAEGRSEGRSEGRVEELVDKTLRLLDAREIAVPAPARERIRSCTDLETLDRWFDRAITAADVSEVFAE